MAHLGGRTKETLKQDVLTMTKPKGFCKRSENALLQAKKRKQKTRARTAIENLQSMGIEAELTYCSETDEWHPTIKGDAKQKFFEKFPPPTP